MKREEIGRLRLRNQRLSGPSWETPEEVVRWLGAVQSQEFGPAKWSIAQRSRGLSEAALDRAFSEGRILRTHVLRPTWHFVLPEDLRWMVELTAPRIRAAMAHYDRKLGLNEAVFAKSNARLARALAGGRQRTRKELAAVFQKAGIAAEGQRMAHLLMRAELDLVICSGAPKGKLGTYALVEERAPRARSLPREEALAELTRRYFTSRGPATPKDFAWWSGLTISEAKNGLEMVRAGFERKQVDGLDYWLAASATGRRTAAPAAHLLQAFDEYVIAYGESRDVSGLSGMIPREQAQTVILEGQAVGHWRRLPDDKRAAVEIRLTRALDAAGNRALKAAVERYGRFKELPAARL